MNSSCETPNCKLFVRNPASYDCVLHFSSGILACLFVKKMCTYRGSRTAISCGLLCKHISIPNEVSYVHQQVFWLSCWKKKCIRSMPVSVSVSSNCSIGMTVLQRMEVQVLSFNYDLKILKNCCVVIITRGWGHSMKLVERSEHR